MALEKQKVNKNTILIASIHNRNHWLFIRIHKGVISIFDSLAQPYAEIY